MKSSSALFSRFMEAQHPHYDGDQAVASFDRQVAGVHKLRQELPAVLKKGWNQNAFSAEQLLAWSKSDKFSAQARQTLATLAERRGELPLQSATTALSDGKLSVKELEGVIRETVAAKPQVRAQAEQAAEHRYLQDGVRLDKAFLDCVQSTFQVQSSFTVTLPRTRVA